MRTKYNKTNPPGRQSGIENSLSLQENESYQSSEDIFSLELYEMQENAEIEDDVNNFYGIGGDDYYYLEVEEG